MGVHDAGALGLCPEDIVHQAHLHILPTCRHTNNSTITTFPHEIPVWLLTAVCLHVQFGPQQTTVSKEHHALALDFMQAQIGFVVCLPASV